MRELREAFSREHALQCGFCTPGMLIAARDIVRRLPERRRAARSGSSCRAICAAAPAISASSMRCASVVEARGSTPVAAGVGADAAPSAAPLPTFVPSNIESRGDAPAGIDDASARSAAPGLDAVRGELRDRRAARDGMAGVRGRSNRRGLSARSRADRARRPNREGKDGGEARPDPRPPSVDRR